MVIWAVSEKRSQSYEYVSIWQIEQISPRRAARRVEVSPFNNTCKILSMKQLDSLAKYWEEVQFRSRLVINHNISVFLDCCEAAIRVDCGVSARSKVNPKKKEAPKQFKQAFSELSREEKVEYYLRVMTYLRSFVDETFNAPISPYSGLLCDVAMVRGRRWKEKKFRLDQGKHLLFVQRKSKILTYDLKDYLLRASKNKEYHSFVLHATNSNPAEKYRTLQMGFTDISKFRLWFDSLKFSIEFREWEFYCSLYKGHITSITDFGQIGRSPSPNHNSDTAKLNLSFSVPRKDKKEDDDDDPLSKSVCTKFGGNSSFRLPEREVFQKRAQMENEKEVNKLELQIKKYQQKRSHLKITKTMIGQLLEGEIIEQPQQLQQRIQEEDEQQKQLKRYLDLFHKLCPEYDLGQLQAFSNFSAIHEEQSFRIYQNHLQTHRFKMVVQILKEGCSLADLMSQLSKPQTAKSLNSNIQDIQIKTNIPSQNSALFYQVLKPFNRLYRARDFVFIRHVFRSGDALYMVDKSIENANYPPFLTIVRGSLCIIYGLFQRQDSYQLIADVQIKNEGYLNAIQETNLTLNFLRQFRSLIAAKPDPSSYRLFDLDWDISKNQANRFQEQIRSRFNTIKHLNGEQLGSQDFRTVNSSPAEFEREPAKELNKSTMQEQGELNAQQLLKEDELKLEITRQLNQKGYIIVDPSFRTHKYITKPIDKQHAKLIYLQSKEGHPIWRKDWQHDDKIGGITFINAKKIEDQKGVLKFILTKMAKNLVSGQSILNVSLPVDIFCPQSNLESFIRSMAYAPLLLQNLQQADALTRMLRTISFGITNSVLYLNMEKPFNPQLGETFQSWINGCPAYAQQISHHPPIASLLLKGRGYDVSAQLESKISVGVNSGTGTNDGVYRIRFSDHMEVCFITPGGEVSGLAHGDRKFNFVGKSYYWIAAENLVLELVFDPFRKGFFSVGKQQQPCDYFQGTIWEVRQDFMAKFFTSKRREPTEKQRVRCVGKVSGVWNKNVLFNGVEIFNFERDLPLAIEHQSAPLPSDSNWREDIEYRRRNQTTRAQIQKERLQVQQRMDRKLRQRRRK